MAVPGVVLDSSAVLVMLMEEPGHRRLRSKLEVAEVLAMGGPTLLEATIVALRELGSEGGVRVKEFLVAWRVQVLAFGRHHWRVAAEASRRYGEGRHPAALGYAACMTYATARLAEMPLLFVGGGFARTDIAPA